MLEGVASAILGKILGDYVTGFESKNLKFSFSGELELSNLQLKQTALDGLDLPIKIKAGFLSKLFLSVPWRNLGSQPGIIRIEKIFVLVGPASVASVRSAWGKLYFFLERDSLFSELFNMIKVYFFSILALLIVGCAYSDREQL